MATGEVARSNSICSPSFAIRLILLCRAYITDGISPIVARRTWILASRTLPAALRSSYSLALWFSNARSVADLFSKVSMVLVSLCNGFSVRQAPQRHALQVLGSCQSLAGSHIKRKLGLPTPHRSPVIRRLTPTVHAIDGCNRGSCLRWRPVHGLKSVARCLSTFQGWSSIPSSYSPFGTSPNPSRSGGATCWPGSYLSVAWHGIRLTAKPMVMSFRALNCQ